MMTSAAFPAATGRGRHHAGVTEEYRRPCREDRVSEKREGGHFRDNIYSAL
jgi:hypothetical protein